MFVIAPLAATTTTAAVATLEMECECGEEGAKRGDLGERNSCRDTAGAGRGAGRTGKAAKARPRVYSGG